MAQRLLPVLAPAGVTLQVTIARKKGGPEVLTVQPGQLVTVQPDDGETVEITRAPRA